MWDIPSHYIAEPFQGAFDAKLSEILGDLAVEIALEKGGATTSSAKSVPQPLPQEALALSLLEKYEKASKKDTYAQSIALLGYAYLGRRAEYQKRLQSMLSTLSLKPSDSVEAMVAELSGNGAFHAWMFGRIAIASKRIADVQMAEKVAEVVKRLLEKVKESDPHLEFAAWAWGYLGIYFADNPASFLLVKEKLLACLEKVQQRKGADKKDDVAWGYVMALSAASKAKDSTLYSSLLRAFQSFYHAKTLLEALRKIPLQDWRAWAISSMLCAAREMQERPLEQELAAALQPAIDASPNDGDKAMALLFSCGALPHK